MSGPTHITFFERFEADIVAGKKTITLRDETENNFTVGSVVDVATYEDNRPFGQLQILSVKPVKFADLNAEHARQENMSLSELKQVISEIYPGIEQLYEIQFQFKTPLK